MASSSSQSVVENEAVLSTIEDDDQPRVVSIPGFSRLPKIKRRALYEKFEAEQRIPALDLAALDSKLLDLTPPPDPDAYIMRARTLEEQARHALLEAGCPPCYPISFEFPVQHVPKEYEALSYYQSLDDTGMVPLTVQLSDWKKFRDYQKRVRRSYLRRKSFEDFEEKVCDRRRRNDLKGHVSLYAEAEKQTRTQNMTEFQDYHLDRYERLKDGITTDKSALVAARKALETGASKDIGTRVEELQWKIEDAESKMQLSEKLLRWIEQQRIAMATEIAAPSHNDESGGHPKSMPTPTSASRRKKNEKTCAPLGPVRSAVSKKSPTNRRRLRSTKRDALQAAETAVTDRNVPHHQRTREHPVESAPPAKESTRPVLSRKAAKMVKGSTLLRPFRPQKVNKTIKMLPKGEASANIKAKMQSSGRFKRPKKVQASTPGLEKRRRGRKLKGS